MAIKAPAAAVRIRRIGTELRRIVAAGGRVLMWQTSGSFPVGEMVITFHGGRRLGKGALGLNDSKFDNMLIGGDEFRAARWPGFPVFRSGRMS